MKNLDENLEQMIKEDYMRAAAEEKTVIQNDDSLVPEGKKEAIYEKISAEIKKKEKEKLFSNMSAEDRRALEIGRKILEEEARRAEEGNEIKEEKTGDEVRVVRRKKRGRVYFGIAAALVLAMAMGITSMGGPEKIMEMVTRMVGDMEVEQVDSSEDNLIIVDGNEEEAYQIIKEEFGVEPTRVVIMLKNMKFVSMSLDEVMQTAELYYEYNDEAVVYLISASHKKSSFGYEIADEVIDKYPVNVHGREIVIKQYNVVNEEIERFSASFNEMGLKYFLTGTMEKSDFEIIVNNLHFLW